MNVPELVMGVAESIRINPGYITDLNLDNIIDALPDWNVKTKENQLIISKDKEKVILLNENRTHLTCMGFHGSNQHKLREIEDAVLKVAHVPALCKGVNEMVAKAPVKTQLMYDSLPYDIDNRKIFNVVDIIRDSPPELMMIKDGELVYKVMNGDSKFVVEYIEPLFQLPSSYTAISNKFSFKSGAGKPAYVI